MKKFRFFFDLEKEENWLKEMAAKGWQLQSVFLTYTFRKSDPDTAPIRIDFHTFWSESKYQDYLSLFEECGWKHIAGYKSMGMHYFAQMKATASDEIFSDTASKAGRYKRISEMWLSLFVSYMCFPIAIFPNLLSNPFGNYLFHPKSAFLTPGIWNLEGAGFWRAFLFESPLAFFRIFTPFLLFALCAAYGIFAIAFLMQYRKCMKSWKKLNNTGSL